MVSYPRFTRVTFGHTCTMSVIVMYKGTHLNKKLIMNLHVYLQIEIRIENNMSCIFNFFYFFGKIVIFISTEKMMLVYQSLLAICFVGKVCGSLS